MVFKACVSLRYVGYRVHRLIEVWFGLGLGLMRSIRFGLDSGFIVEGSSYGVWGCLVFKIYGFGFWV